MAALREIRKRIRTTRNTQKITKAMKLVAASKFKRAQDAMLQARPYARELQGLLARVAAAAAAAPGYDPTQPLHPLLAQRPKRRILLLMLTSDRGLCGAFNSNILRRAERFLWQNADAHAVIEAAALGRKGSAFITRRPHTVRRALPIGSANLTYAQAQQVADVLVSAYAGGELDGVVLLYNEFVSAISQRIALHELLPIGGAPSAEAKTEALRAPAATSIDLPGGPAAAEHVYEPTQRGVLDALLPRYVATLVWRASLESVACEHGARMTAMDAATRNARELTDKLTLQYNRARQATITRELMDIVGGAEAQNG